MICPHCGKFIEIENFRGENQKSGMIKKASQGEHMSRAPFGYILEKGKLIPSEKSKEVEEILRQASLKFNLSARSYMKMIKVARTIADLDNSEEIAVPHMAEALQYSPKNFETA